MKKRKFIESLNDAIDGLLRIFREQRNMRLHIITLTLLLILGLILGMNKFEIIILFLAGGLILLMEIINSCTEEIINFFHPEYDAKIKIIKDMWAGAVLFSGLLAGIIFYLIFSSYLTLPIENGIQRLRNAQWYLTFLTLIIVILFVILIKATLGRGKPLRGGLPSGHSAVAFSIWTMILFLKPDVLIGGLVLILAVLIALSRIKERIHSLLEVIWGAMIGILVTVLIFQIIG